MRISDWSSDVCSSDLDAQVRSARITAIGAAVAQACFKASGDRYLFELPPPGATQAVVRTAIEGLVGGIQDADAAHRLVRPAQRCRMPTLVALMVIISIAANQGV